MKTTAAEARKFCKRTGQTFPPELNKPPVKHLTYVMPAFGVDHKEEVRACCIRCGREYILSFVLVVENVRHSVEKWEYTGDYVECKPR